MEWIEVLFFVFAGVIVLGVLALIFSRLVIHAAFILVAIMVSLAGIYILFGAEYLAVVQLLVYAGGIVVLLAFGIMLTQQVKEGATPSGFHLLFPGLLIGVTIAFTLAKSLTNSAESLSIRASTTIEKPVRAIGFLFMTDYLLAFEMIAYLLLVVLVGASFYAKQSALSKL
jgi:NADH:ubiquinone oxidoreductase subunit 6 (subunit J)